MLNFLVLFRLINVGSDIPVLFWNVLNSLNFSRVLIWFRQNSVDKEIYCYTLHEIRETNDSVVTPLITQRSCRMKWAKLDIVIYVLVGSLN